MECPKCGEAALDGGDRRRALSGCRYPCGVCGGHHQAECSAQDAVSGGRGIAWPARKPRAVLLRRRGEPGDGRAMEGLALRVDKETARSRDEAFTDNVIMYEVLSELKDMAGRGGVRCTCGSRDYGIRIHRDAVDLTCRACGGRLRLPAATDKDPNQLCCRMTLGRSPGERAAYDRITVSLVYPEPGKYRRSGGAAGLRPPVRAGRDRSEPAAVRPESCSPGLSAARWP